MTTTDHRPRDLAMKRPAVVVEFEPEDDGRTVDGHWRATRGGAGASKVLSVAVFLILAFLLTGLGLSMWQQYS